MKRTEKIIRFLNGRGFYAALCAGMVALGLCTYGVMRDRTKPATPDPVPETSTAQPAVPPVTETDPPVSDEAPLDEAPPAEEPVAGEVKAERFVLPLPATVDIPYNDSELQYSPTYRDWRVHTGTDYTPTGSLVVCSCGAGTVVAVDVGTALGDVITINHGGGVYLRYCGVKNMTVNPGDVVAEGEPLGEIGVVESECEQAAHLHLEAVVDGKPVDPATLFE